MQLEIDGTVVRTWNDVGTSLSSYVYQASGNVSVDQVRVVFTNDLFDPSNGIDRNLIVDNIEVDGTVFQTEAPTVFFDGYVAAG